MAGDHRCFVLHCRPALLNIDVFPSVDTSKTRKLHCRLDRLIMNYSKVMNQVCDRHQMLMKLLDIQESSPLLIESEFMLLVNKSDKEFEDNMKLAKNQCHTFMDSRIKWRPMVRVRLIRRWMLGHVNQFLNTPVPDPHSLFMTKDKLAVEMELCINEMEMSATKSPMLHCAHLNS